MATAEEWAESQPKCAMGPVAMKTATSTMATMTRTDACDGDGPVWDGDDSDDDDECGVMMMTTMACTLACVDMGHIYEHGQEQGQ